MEIDSFLFPNAYHSHEQSLKRGEVAVSNIYEGVDSFSMIFVLPPGGAFKVQVSGLGTEC